MDTLAVMRSASHLIEFRRVCMLHNFDTMVAQLNITVLNAIRVRLRYFVEFFADLVSRLHIDLK